MSPTAPEPEWDDDDWNAFARSLPALPPAAQARVQAFIDEIRTPLAPGDPLRHHYIPRFFLSRFADANNQLAVVRLNDPDTYDLISTVNIAVQNDLYTTIDTEVGETVFVEKLLATVDGAASGAIARLAFGMFFPPQSRDRYDLAIWLGLLNVRDPYTRRVMEALADQTLKMDLSLVRNADIARVRLREMHGKEPSDEDVQALLDTVANLDDIEVTPHQNDLVVLALQTGMSLVPHLLQRLYSIIRFPEPGLVLCDRPIILFQHAENRSPFVGVGPINADEIWLPLDRGTALILHNDAETGERILDAPPGRTIDEFNQTVVAHAHAEIYCHPDDVNRLDNLTLPEPDRPLLQVHDAGSFLKGGTDGVNRPPRRKRHRRYRRQTG